MTVVESAGYTPFEQLQTRGNVGPWSDLYSLAATVVKVMTGEAPPKANDRTMGDPWQPLAVREDLKAQYSFEFLRALDQALRLPIDERWQNADEFKKALEGKSSKVVEHLKENETVFPPLKIEPLPKSKKVAVWMIGLCFTLCALGYGFWEIGKCDVHITSNPPGAEVVQNGKILGRTPFSFDSLSPFSKWQVDLRLKGHESQVIQGSVTWRERTVAPVSQLEALPQKVIITSEPLGAEVLFGEKSLGVTPWESEPMEVADEISYRLRLPGYNEKVVTARLEVGETSRLDVRLERDKWYAFNAAADVRAQMAEAGDAYAQALLGHDKFFGAKVGMTFEEIAACKKEGETWIRKSAEQNHPLGLALLGHFHMHQDGDPNKDEAVKFCNVRSAKHGLITEHNQNDPYWSFYVGNFFRDGYGVSKDVNEAVKWYRKAAEQGYSIAQYALGLSYENGFGVEKDLGEALKWISESAEQGFAYAQLDLGGRCLTGKDIEEDPDEAARWFGKAAQQGLDLAQYAFGICYQSGHGVAKDEAEAVNWYRKAAEQGHAEAQRTLGVCYSKGVGVEKEEVEAAKWYRKAAEQGEAHAQHFLGLCYTNGRGVTKNHEEAVKWYRKAAEQGQALAQNNLGSSYANGIGIEKNEAEAIRWYRKAAEQGDALAQNNLGSSYANGIGIEKNEAEAIRWYRKAAEQGDATAQYNLGNYYKSGTGVLKDEKTAVVWYRKSAEQEFSDAQFQLGGCYLFGNGVKENKTEAIKWLRKSADSGNADGLASASFLK
jgi:TPR repeat protein